MYIILCCTSFTPPSSQRKVPKNSADLRKFLKASAFGAFDSTEESESAILAVALRFLVIKNVQGFGLESCWQYWKRKWFRLRPCSSWKFKMFKDLALSVVDNIESESDSGCRPAIFENSKSSRIWPWELLPVLKAKVIRIVALLILIISNVQAFGLESCCQYWKRKWFKFIYNNSWLLFVIL